jgi:phage-related protein
VDKLAGFFNGLLDVVKFLIDNFKIFLPIITGVTFAIVAQQILATIVPLYKAWRAATVGMTLAQAALNAVMALNPFTWIALAIGAVIAAVVAIIFYWDEIKAAAKATWNWLASFFKTKLGMIVAIMGGPITMALAIIANWELIKTKAALIWDAIVYKVKTFVLKFRLYFQNLRSRVAEIMQGMQDFFKTKIGLIVAILGGPITIGLAIIANWKKIKAKAIEIWDGIVSKFQSVKEKIVGVFSSIKNSVKNAFSSLWDIIKKPLNFIIAGLNSFIGAYEKVINKISELINKIPAVKIPDWVPGIGGKTLKIPSIPKLDIPNIPALAEGGIIQRAGTVLVGEEGPEFLNLPRAAQVTPLDKSGQSIVININDAKLFNERDGERLGELIVKSLKLKGIVPRGV